MTTDTIPTIEREIKYSRQDRDYACYVNGQYIGSRANYSDGEALCNQVAYDLLMDGQCATATELDGGSEPDAMAADHAVVAPVCMCGEPATLIIHDGDTDIASCERCYEIEYDDNEARISSWTTDPIADHVTACYVCGSAAEGLETMTTDTTDSIDAIVAFAEPRGACGPALSWLGTQPDPTTAWQACEEPGWLIWWLKQQPATDRKTLVRIACACARTALRFVPEGEDRPRIAIETAERWLTGGATIREVRAAGIGARAAAADAAADAAAGSGYAAGYAADAAADADAGSGYVAGIGAADAADAAADAADARHRANIQMCGIIRAIARMDGGAL